MDKDNITLPKRQLIPLKSVRGKVFSNGLTVIPEVSLPTTLSARGKSKDEYTHQIQQWVDKYENPTLFKVPSFNQPSTISEIVCQLTNQIYLDNNEHLYVLITDVTSYPETSKPEIWFDNSGHTAHRPIQNEEDESAVAVFNNLFNVGPEIFVVFLFSPMDITFELKIPEQNQANQGSIKMTNVFFHGNSTVHVNTSENNGNNGRGIISIQFHER